MAPRSVGDVANSGAGCASHGCHRSAGGPSMLDRVRYDLKHALCGLLRDRAFTAVALLSVGLGVGANSAIFSLVDQALYRQLPVREPEKLVLLNWKGNSMAKGWGSGNLMSNPIFRQLKAENAVFDGMLARHPTD